MMDHCDILRVVKFSISVVSHVTDVYLSLLLWVIIVLPIEAWCTWHVECTSSRGHPATGRLAFILILIMLTDNSLIWLIECGFISIFNLSLIAFIVILKSILHFLWFLKRARLLTSYYWIFTTVKRSAGVAVFVFVAAWRWLHVGINLFGPDQERVRLVVDNSDLSCRHDKLIDKLIQRVTAVDLIVKDRTQVQTDPSHYLGWLNAHGKLFEHLVKQS